MAITVVVTDYEYADIAWERRIVEGAGFRLVACQLRREEELIPAVADADGLIIQYADVNANVIASLSRCKIMVRYGIGYDNIDVAAATRRGILVSNVPDYGIDEVSNHAIAMMLSLARKLPLIREKLRSGVWGYEAAAPVTRFEEATVGLLGLGRIARSVARKLSGFGVRLIAHDPFIQENAAGVELVSFATLCRESDYLSLHCPLTGETRHKLNREAFRLMKPSAVLINTARGGLVCQEDLIDALRRGALAGAGVDVYEKEPLERDSPLLQMENVIATPHFAWYSEQAITSLQRKAAEEAVRVLSGQAQRYPCNPELLRV
ncbi:MAG: C-terminal binding protein [Gracilibacteraceae bacterium]|jgi:D-3-phosphoglycerate dehydrogenase|nr:C-terminal binding protein [Gracilibacteraceae bacterium]